MQVDVLTPNSMNGSTNGRRMQSSVLARFGRRGAPSGDASPGQSQLFQGVTAGKDEEGLINVTVKLTPRGKQVAVVVAHFKSTGIGAKVFKTTIDGRWQSRYVFEGKLAASRCITNGILAVKRRRRELEERRDHMEEQSESQLVEILHGLLQSPTQRRDLRSSCV